MSRYDEPHHFSGLEVAVIGMSCRFPGAENIEQFWDNLKDGVESITFLSHDELVAEGATSEKLNHPGFVNARGYVDEAEYFDPAFFGYKPIEAGLMDPQMRLFYECCWEALETAGYNPHSYEGLIGLYAGATNNRGWEMPALFTEKGNVLGPFALDHLIDRDFLSTRLAYKLDLRGPAVTMKTACSTAVVAVDMACRSLLTGQCQMALAGAVSLISNASPGYVYREGMIQSPDGHCRAFAAGSRGVIFSEGAGVVLLKRFRQAAAEGDHIEAVIRGSAVNNDGSRKGTYEAPCVEGQAEVIRAALHLAEVDPETVTYVETHGTGTVIGDPIEVEALNQAFDSQRRGFCAIGSVKSNFGHLDTAAGIAGFIKVVLSLKHRLIPPSLHFDTPNPRIDFEASPFFVNTCLREWQPPGDRVPRRAGISSFGVGGTNVHVVLEEAPVEEKAPAAPDRQRPRLILLSAHIETALNTMTQNLASYFKEHPGIQLADAAYTLQVGRRAMAFRKMVAANDTGEAGRWLSASLDPESPDFGRAQTAAARDKNNPVFMFPGQGAQYVNMGRQLYEQEPVFRREMDACFDTLQPLLDDDLREILYPGDASTDTSLERTEIAQPLLFCIEMALAQLLMAWGITPYAMTGHSIGEYVAACIAGVFSLEDALKVVALRGRLMQQMPGGAMLSVTLPESDVLRLLEGHQELSLAAVNAPSLCVVSGPHEAVDAFEKQLEADGHQYRRLHTSHAFHSAMMEPILDEFAGALQQISLSLPQIPYISNITGTWAGADEVTPAYWARHLRRCVRFGDGLAELLKDSRAVFIELGPGRSLSTFVNKHHLRKADHLVLNLVRHPREDTPDELFLLNKIGQLWLHGIQPDWQAFHHGEERRRLPLPTYPFQRQLYKLDVDLTKLTPGAMAQQQAASQKREDIGQWFYAPCWKRSVRPHEAAENGAEPLNWLFLLDEYGLGAQVAEGIKRYYPKDRFTMVTMAPSYEAGGDGTYRLNPGQADDYRRLLTELKGRDQLPQRVVHLWSITADGTQANDPVWDEAVEDRCFYSLVYLARAAGEAGIDREMQWSVVTAGMQDVSGEGAVFPQQAAVLGPVSVIPREYANISCRSLDVVLPRPGSPGERVLVDQLAAECRAASADRVVAFRRHYRLVQAYEPLPLPGGNGQTPRIKPGGVYLVTGGLGGIGLVLARRLSTCPDIKLVLVGRTPPDNRQKGKIRELEDNGAQVFVMSADVADAAAMQAVAQAVEKRWGGIHGVIHAAGVPGGGMIQLKERQSADAVLRPKVRGTVVLHRVLKDHPPDFMVLCSSINAVVPMLGQVDYCAANAFMDAFAYYKTAHEGVPTVSINWDSWQEVGMAVKAAQKYSGARQLDHPLLEQCIRQDGKSEVYVTHFALDRHWVLNEHKVAESGKGLVPGVTYLEMARAAFAGQAGNGAVRLSDVYFLNPLMVGEGEERETRLILKKGADGCDFVVESRQDSQQSNWQRHAVGKIAAAGEAAPPVRHRIDRLAARCSGKDIREFHQQTDSQGQLLIFGPRWKNSRRIRLADDRGLALLELDEAFAGEVAQYGLHPALLDSATGFLFGHVGGGAYIPFSYKEVTVKQPLTSKLYSFSRVLEEQAESTGQESLKFDITLMDEAGEELVAIREFTMLRVSDEVKARIREKEGVSPDIDMPGQPEPLKSGILPDEGVEAFERILQAALPQVVVSTTDLSSRLNLSLERDTSLSAAAEDTARPTGPAHPRPSLSTVYTAPRNELEQQVADAWQRLLGIEKIGIHDDFFELGGDSLNIVQLNNELKKELKQDIPVAVMFRYLTVHAFVEYLNSGGEGAEEAADEADRLQEVEQSKNRLKQRMKQR